MNDLTRVKQELQEAHLTLRKRIRELEQWEAEHRQAEAEAQQKLAAMTTEKTKLEALIASIRDEIWFADLRGNFPWPIRQPFMSSALTPITSWKSKSLPHPWKCIGLTAVPAPSMKHRHYALSEGKSCRIRRRSYAPRVKVVCVTGK